MWPFFVDPAVLEEQQAKVAEPPPAQVIQLSELELAETTFGPRSLGPGLARLSPDDWVRGQLTQLASGLADCKLRSEFSDADLPTKGQIFVLEHVSSGERIAFNRSLCRLALERPDFMEWCEGYLDNVLRAAPKDFCVAERVALIESVHDDRLVELVVRSTDTMEELLALIDKIGEDWFSTPFLEEYLVRAKVGSVAQEIELPARLKRTCTPKEVDDFIEELHTALAQLDVLTLVESEHSLTETWQHFEKIGQTETVNIAIDFGRLDHLLCRCSNPITDEQYHNRRVRLANATMARIGLELKYGILVSYEEENDKHTSDYLKKNPDVPRSMRLWSEQDIADIGTVFSKIAEGYWFPYTNLTIFRCKTLEDDAYGTAGESGVVRITNNIGGLRRDYPGARPLQILIAHELTHIHQLCGQGHSIKKKLGQAVYCLPSNGLGFNELGRFANWKLIPPAKIGRFHRDVGKDKKELITSKVKVNGTEYPTGEEVEIDGRTVCIVYHEGIDQFFSYDPTGEFPPDSYSKTTKLEYGAEAWSEYAVRPHKLRAEAPGVFNDLNWEFRVYPR